MKEATTSKDITLLNNIRRDATDVICLMSGIRFTPIFDQSHKA